jgi:ABC-type uncharacterized transport system involved in gliding motility auxiliary subunit
MNKKQTEKLLFSVAGVLIMFVIIVAANIILGFAKARVDLTADRLFTLSDGTKKILDQLSVQNQYAEIRFYFSNDRDVHPVFKNYAQRVEDLLNEFRVYSHGRIVVKKLNPQPDSDEQDAARLDGVEGQPIQVGEELYMGLAVSIAPDKVAIPFLDPQRETLLEYDIARALTQVMNPKKAVVGLMTPLPMFGQEMNPMMMRMGQQGQEPWLFVQELKRDFDLKQVPMDSETIDPDVKVLVVVHPKDISDKAQYAIDQFVLRGGKLIAFLDAMSLADKPANPQNPMMANLPGGPSSLDKLLKAWGLTFENSKVVADMTYATMLSRGHGGGEKVPTFLTVNETGIEKNDILTSQLKKVMIPFGGAFSGTPATGLKQTVLLQTTTESQFVDGMQAQFNSKEIADKFQSSGSRHTLATRLEGKFKTAFPDGKPGADKKEGDKKDGDKKDDKPADAGGLKESKTDGVVILVGDSDMLYDQFTVQVQNFFGQKLVQYFNDNLAFAQNMVEQMAGDSNLIRVRSRAVASRPFTVVQEMETKAQARHRETLRKLEEGLQETQHKINELQQHKKEAGQRFVLSPEQQAEIAKFRKQESEAKAKLKNVRKDLRKDIESLEGFLKGANIAGMPLLVAVAGVGLWVVRKNRSGAK